MALHCHASHRLTLSPVWGAVILVTLAGCAAQSPPPASTPAVVQAPKHKKRTAPTPDDILAAQPSQVQTAIKQHVQGRAWPTFRHGTTILYPYSDDSAPVVECAPLRTTDIQLEAGETITDVALGDAQRWMATPAAAGDAVRNPTPHIVVKPEMPGIATNLIIYTASGRIYHIDLRTRPREMREVKFYYPEATLAAMAQTERALKQPADTGGDANSATPSALPDVDPSHLNFAYKVDGPRRLPWTPERVFDDGIHVFLEMPASMRTTSAPALLVEAAGGRQMVNYRVVQSNTDGGSYFVVDSLFSKAELVSGVGRDQDRVLVTYSGTGR